MLRARIFKLSQKHKLLGQGCGNSTSYHTTKPLVITAYTTGNIKKLIKDEFWAIVGKILREVAIAIVYH